MSQRQVVIKTESLEVQTSNGERLVSDLNFSIAKGEYLLLRGENGSGKSTIAQTLMGYHRYFTGKIEIRVDRRQIGYLPQLGNTRFFLPLTLSDVLGLEKRDPARRKRALSYGLLEDEQLRLSWNTASGGERQKALILRTLLEDPALLILDEPFNHLDQSSRAKLTEVLNSLLESKLVGILLISHEGEIPSRSPSMVIELGRSK